MDGTTVRHVEELGGKGDVLILVHGLGGSTNTWYPQAQVIRRDFRVVAYDLAGSARTPVRDDISIESHVRDLLEVVDSVAPQGKVHLGAHSMGTIIAQHFAATYPDRVLSLAMVGGFAAPPEAARDALRARGAKVRSEGVGAIADAIVAGGTSTDTKGNQPTATAFVRESIMGQPSEGYARNCEALAAAVSADLERIRCPVLFLTGDEDKTAPPEVAQALATQLAKAEVQILPGCGHWATVERPKQVNYALSLFYARQRRAAEA